MSNFLSQVTRLKQKDLSKLAQKNNDFLQMINNATNQKKIAIIAEIKLASPTSKKIGSAKDLLIYANTYQKAGCDAISIITDKHFFNGRQYFVTKVKKHTKLPILQKDFVIDPFQIYQAKKSGADAILLIAKLLTTKDLTDFVDFAQKLRIEPVVEIDNEEGLKKAVKTTTKIIAVNARNLDNFEIDVDKACNLLKKVPSKFIKLGFSGIKDKTEVEKYKRAGAAGILIGTSLMKTKNVYQFLESIKL